MGLYIVLALVGLALLAFIARNVIWPSIKFLFYFLKWVLKTLPILILIAIFVPGVLDEGVYLIVVLILAIAETISSGSSYSVEHFVLNKKSRIAHRVSDPSADTIGANHRDDVYATEYELKERGFRIKKDS